MSLLPSSFYERNDVVQVAKDLLGKYIVSTIGGKYTSGMIVETEAYRAPDDKGCHAYQNKFTNRTSTMFEIGGTSYVYICYGIHDLFNVVTGPQGAAQAVLIRAIEPIDGVEHMMSRRGLSKVKIEMVNGPGKFTKAMQITKAQNNISLMSKADELWIEDRDTTVIPTDQLAGPRVGMGRSVADCSNWPWRFRIRDNKWTSKPDKVYYDWA